MNVVILLNDMPIECDERFIKSNFQQLFKTKNQNKNDQTKKNQISIQIDGANNFYEVTKDIFQGNDYEITDDNVNYLGKLSQQIKNGDLQTKLNLFCYQRECNENQIDQHPSIQFLIELSTLIRHLSLKNYEDYSSQIKEKFDLNNKLSKSRQKKGKKAKKKKVKKGEEKLSLKNMSKKSLCKLFYNEIVNNLSSNFHSIEEFKEHQKKVDLIIHIIKEIDSNFEEEEENSKNEEEEDIKEESKTYLSTFINYVIKKYHKIQKETSSIINHRQETFYLIHYLLSNELTTFEKIQEEKGININLDRIWCPEYFLHFYTENMIKKYFRNHSELLESDNQIVERNTRTRKSKKSNQYDDNFEGKVQKYLKGHKKKIERGFSFDDDELFEIIMNDDLNEFKSHIKSKIIEKKQSNKTRRRISENVFINDYKISSKISKFSCISALTNCTMIELAAFFGSKEIFKYLNVKRLYHKISNPKNLLNYITVGRDPQIIKMYLNPSENEGQINDDDDDEIDTESQSENDEETESNLDQESDELSQDFSYNEDDDDFNSGRSSDEDFVFVDEPDSYDDYNNNNNDSKLSDTVDIASTYFIPSENKLLKKNSFYNNFNNMMSLSIDLCCQDNYELLNEVLTDFNSSNETNFIINFYQLDQYMRHCISRGYFEMIPSLLKEGANINVLLNLFSKTNNEIGIEYMVEFSYIDVNFEYNKKSALEYCIENKNSNSSVLLLKNDKIDLNCYDDPEESIFLTSCRYGLSKVVEFFLQKNLFDANMKTAEGIRPIHLTCKSGNYETVLHIVNQKKKKIKINGAVTKGKYKGFTPFHFACKSGNPKIVELLLEKFKIDVNLKDEIKEWTPLQYAVFKGHTEVVLILLDQPDIKTNVITGEGESLLHLACMSNKEEIVDIIINSPNISTKFNLNLKTKNEKTPLQIAILNGNYKMIEILLNRTNKQKKTSKKQKSNVDLNILTSNGQTPLILACEMKRLDIFTLFLKNDDIDVNAQGTTGKTALFVACELNLIEMIKLLLENKEIDPNITTKLGKTPIIVACEKGNKEVVDLLINFNKQKNRKTKVNLIDFNAKNSEGKTSLAICCEYLRLDIAKMLIQLDELDCNCVSTDGKTPLCYFCEKRYEDLVSELIDRGANVNYHTNDDKTPLYFACLGQNANIVRMILSKLEDTSEINLKESINETTPLFIACQKGDLEIFNLLTNELEEGEDLNYQDKQGRTLLYIACESENIEIIKSLLTEFNINSNIPDNEGKYPLQYAIEKKNLEIVESIVNCSHNYIDINERFNNMTPIEIACEVGSIEIVQFLINQEGIQINQIDKNDIPPLILACNLWKTDIIKLLLTEVVDINVDVSSSSNKTALHYSCEKGDAEITELILNKSVESLTVRTTNMKTPLEFACKSGNAEVTSLLLKHIGDIHINAKFDDGNTVLTQACLMEKLDIVDYLLKNTIIDVNALNNDDKTALFIIAENGNEQICELLLNHEKIDIDLEINQKTALYEACRFGNTDVVELLIKKGAKTNCVTKNGKTPLHVACQNGYSKIVTLLLNSQEVDVNLLTISPKNIRTCYAPLHLACMNNRSNIKHSHNSEQSNKQLCVEVLINNPKTDINVLTSMNETALVIASDKLNYDIIKILLQDTKIDPNAKGRSGNTVLHVCCQNNKLDLIEILLNNPNTDVNLTNIDDKTPLLIACEAKNLKMVKLLLKRENLLICQSNQINPIKKAIDMNNIELFNILYNHPSFNVNEPDKYSATPLCYAINSGNIELVLQLLLNSQIDVNKKSLTSNLNNNAGYRYFGFYHNNNNNKKNTYITPLSLAIKVNNYKIVKLLCQTKNININKYSNGKTALQKSIKSKRDEITNLLLSLPQIDVNLITKIDKKSIAAKSQQQQQRNSYSFSYRRKENNKYLMGQSALHIAIQEHNINACRELLKHDELLINEYTTITDPSYSDIMNNKYKDGCNSLYIACGENQKEIVSLLLSRSDIDVNATSTEQKLTPLHVAVKSGYTEIVKILLSDERCDLSIASYVNNNLLFFAAESGNLNLLKLFLSKDPNSIFTSTASDGNTLFHLICDKNKLDILKSIFEETKDSSLFDINVQNKIGETPLHLASKFDISENYYIKRSNFNTTYINDYKTKTILGFLIDHNADINACNLYGQTPLHYACQNCCYSNIEVLLMNPNIIVDGPEQIVNSNSTPFITLITALMNKNDSSYRGYRRGYSNRLIQIISEFIKRGANYKFILKDGLTFLHFALKYRSIELIKTFIQNTTNDELKTFLNIDSKYGNPFEIAIENWDKEIIEIFFEKKEDIKFNEKIKEKIIYNCVSNDDVKSLIQLLLNNDENDPNLDFNVNYTDDRNRTPLHLAVEHNNSLICNILANYDKTDTNILDKNGKSALHNACMRNENIALAILTKVDLNGIKQMFDKDKTFNNSNFNQFLMSQVTSMSTLNDKIDINLQTAGMSRRDFIRAERARQLAKYPYITQFNIHYNEPSYNIGFTPLHISISNRQVNVVQKILLYPTLNINEITEHGDSAISLVAKNWNTRIVQLLINYPGINLNYVPKEEENDDEFDENGNSPGTNPNNNIAVRPLSNLMQMANHQEESYEIQRKRENQNKTILHAACDYNSIEIIEIILQLCKSGAFNINEVDSYDKMSSLHYICKDGSVSLLNLFVEFEENNKDMINWNIKSKTGMTPLHVAVENEQVGIVDILLNNEIVCPHIDINATATGEFVNGRTPLSFACEKGNLQIVELLLNDKIANEDDKNDDDNPFTFHSSDHKNKVERGSLCGAKSECDLNIKSKAASQRGMSALHYACKGPSTDVVKLILKHGEFNINTRASGKTCLFLACQYNNTETVKLLLEQNDIDYNLKTPRGMTPLMIASQNGNAEIVEMLLKQHNIDKDALTVEGESAESLAKNFTISNLFDKYE